MTQEDRDLIAAEVEASELSAEITKKAQQYDICTFIQHIIDENGLHDIVRIDVSTPSYPGCVPEVNFVVSAMTCIGDMPVYTDMMFRLEFDIPIIHW